MESHQKIFPLRENGNNCQTANVLTRTSRNQEFLVKPC
uniref:Uncharacterized protein n=1 Tax=uncultured Desulfobacterium sp. TaxID=201089 RepID=E1YC77_9BACT|nr:unknown protein [uncultured Desulfobacterium sp.]